MTDSEGAVWNIPQNPRFLIISPIEVAINIVDIGVVSPDIYEYFIKQTIIYIYIYPIIVGDQKTHYTHITLR